MNPKTKSKVTPRLSYIIGVTLIHFENVEGPHDRPTVKSLFSIPKSEKALADKILVAVNNFDAMREALQKSHELLYSLLEYFDPGMEREEIEKQMQANMPILARICEEEGK